MGEGSKLAKAIEAAAARLISAGHAARLSFGDRFSCALAKASREPLLFKGQDFARTEIVAAR